jgi:23S rRNA pseudouridine1911/1915/1917 synthase
VTRETLPDGLDAERVDRVVAMLTGCSRSEAAELVATGKVLLDGDPVTIRSAKVRSGQVIDIDDTELGVVEVVEADASIDLVVVHEDPDVVVVDKPAGLVVHPGSGNLDGTLVNAALARWPDMADAGDPGRPGVVHRIDQGTSGLLVLARTPAAYEALVAQFSGRTVQREYLALCWGHVEPAQGMIDAPIGRSQRDPTRMTVTNTGREARTRYEVLEQFTRPADLTLVSCRLETGRTHQIRVHLGAIGHPIVGDRHYGGNRQNLPCARPWLHAAQLGFEHPTSGAHLSFHSELPADLVAVLDVVE